MGRKSKQSDQGEAQEWARRMSRTVSKTTGNEFKAWVLEKPENARLFFFAVYETERHTVPERAPRAEVVPLPVRADAAPLFAQHWRTRAAETGFSSLLQRLLFGGLGIGVAGFVVAYVLGFVPRLDQGRLFDAGRVREVVTLAGGTIVTLEPGSRMLVPFLQEERKVRLERGNALFQVVPAAHRVFWVTFPGGSVETVGTTFRVADQGNRMDVAVYEGKVRIHSARSNPPPPVAIAVGTSAQVSREGVVKLFHIDSPPPVAVRDALPVSASLLEIAAVYNARHPGRPLILDPEVQHERILLNLDEMDPDQILPVLRALDQFVLEPGPQAVVVKPKSPQGSHAISQMER